MAEKSLAKEIKEISRLVQRKDHHLQINNNNIHSVFIPGLAGHELVSLDYIYNKSIIGYEDDEYCSRSETPDLRRAYGKDSGVTLPGRSGIRLTFVPQRRAGG